VSVQLLVMLVE